MKSFWRFLLTCFCFCAWSFTAFANEAILPPLAGTMLIGETQEMNLEKRLHILPDTETVMVEVEQLACIQDGNDEAAYQKAHAHTTRTTYIGHIHPADATLVYFTYKNTTQTQAGIDTNSTRDYDFRETLKIKPTNSGIELVDPKTGAYNTAITGSFANIGARLEYNKDITIFQLESIPANGQCILQPRKHHYRYEIERVNSDMQADYNEKFMQRFFRSYAGGYYIIVKDENDKFVDELVVDEGVRNIYRPSQTGWQHIYSDEAMG